MPSTKTSRPFSERARLAVLVSGRGSNLQSIIDAISEGRLEASIAVVVSNKPDAYALTRAQSARIEVLFVDPKDYSNRTEYDRAIADALKSRGVSLVCLAGYMRLIGQPLLAAFPNRILNIHPSLLPAFPGLDAQRQAVEHGVRVSGCTVHLVTAGLDDGPIILQASVPVTEDDTADTLAARILVEEHRIYPEAIGMLLDDDWVIEGRRLVRKLTK